MWRAVLVLVGCSTSGSPEPPSPPRAPTVIDAAVVVAPSTIPVTGSLRVLADTPAWGFEVATDRAIAIDDGFLTMSGYDTATGKRAWQTQIQQVVRGRHTLHPAGATMLAWAGDKVHVLDVATGSLRASYPRSMNTSWEQGGCGIDHQDGVCAQTCQCSFHLFDCATGTAIGKTFQFQYVERTDPSGHRSAGCYGLSGHLLATMPGAALISTEEITAALDRQSGKELWRRDHHSSWGTSGVSPDRKTCLLAPYDHTFAVADCATGKTLWQSDRAKPDTSIRAFFFAGGLYELRDRRATLYDERTGKPRWRVTLPAGVLAWPSGATVLMDVRSSIAILEPSNGKTLAAIAHPSQTGLELATDGSFVLYGKGVFAHYDPRGGKLGQAAHDAPEVILGQSLVIAHHRKTETIVLDAAMRELGRIPGGWDSVAVEGPLGKRRLVAFRYDGKVVGRLLVLAVD